MKQTAESAVLVMRQSKLVVAQLRQMGPVAADKAIEQFADVHGDEETKNLVEQLPPLVVADIVKEFDSTKMGMAGSLLTPSGLRKVIEHLPLIGADARRLRDTVCAVILQHEKMATRAKYFKEIAKSEIGKLSLAAAVADGEFCCDFLLFASTGRFDEEDDEPETFDSLPHGGWEELCFSLRNSSRSVYFQILEKVKSFNKDKAHDFYGVYVKEVKRVFGVNVSASDDPYAITS